ncbi:MAG: UvrD-helicase domain-containing protein [Candidatus Shapirobacteria bacterium]|nr:UvrD-helicase domain-containing protein [Candidatus Shapirobacteria bacterium]
MMPNLDNNILSHLNQAQQEAVAFGPGPLLILAGPGSGKTRTLIHRAAWLILKKGVNPENILLLTFTNKASSEMKERLKKLLTADGQQPIAKMPFAGTFHSFCAKVLRADGHFLNIPKNFTIYDDHDQEDTIKKVLEKLDLSPKQYKPSSVLATISQAKNEMITALEYPQYARGIWQETVARIYLKYQQFLKEYQALDFDDLLLETVRLFQKEKSILAKYQDQYQWVLIDEYQDTNHVQYLLTKLLVKKHQNLNVVGDASQAIYGWRGADFRNLLSLRDDFPNLKVINLEQNYRSTQTILNAANNVIKKNTSHPVLNLWTAKKGGEKISLYEAQNEQEEAHFIVDIIKTHLLSTPNSSLKKFAVLYRTNAQSRIIEETLLHSGLSYLLVGGVRFYERKEIKDCLAYLRVLANPQDKISYQRIEKLGKTRLKKFQELAKKNKSKEIPALEWLDEILAKTDYLQIYDESDPQDLARVENVKELRSVAAEFPDLNQFLENVALIQQEYLPTGKINPQKDNNVITLMTAHAAKGTEFPIVFIIGLEEGLFPHARALMEKNEVEEERRLCYVAMTRAKEKLYLSYTKRRFYFGENSQSQASRFINDIPKELVDMIR